MNTIPCVYMTMKKSCVFGDRCKNVHYAHQLTNIKYCNGCSDVVVTRHNPMRKWLERKLAEEAKEAEEKKRVEEKKEKNRLKKTARKEEKKEKNRLKKTARKARWEEKLATASGTKIFEAVVPEPPTEEEIKKILKLHTLRERESLR